jgi:phage replication O-like protein O
MADPASIPPPNYTQIPNAIFELMADKEAHFTEAELRVVLAIARKTFGWHKKRDKLSLTQLEKLTAMSRPSVKAGIDAAIARGLVRRTPDKDDGRGGFYYELLVDEPNEPNSKKSLLVKNVNQLKELTDTSKESLPELVKNLYPQKKDKEKKETSSSHVAFLIDQGMGAAMEFQDLEPDAAIADFKRRVKDGQSVAQIVRAWRLNAPVRKPEPNGTGPPGYRPPADALTPEERDKKLKELRR